MVLKVHRNHKAYWGRVEGGGGYVGVVVVEVLLDVHRRLLGTGAQDGHLDFHTAPEL